MMHLIRIVMAGGTLLLGATANLHGQTPEDREGVRRAVMDYVEGFYEGDTAKLVRSIHPDVQKFGFWPNEDAPGYSGLAMPWPEFLAYARRVRTRGTPTPADAPKEITLFEVLDQTANAKLRAWWGTDHLLLAKYDGRWMVRMVLWQGTPPPPRN